MVAEFRRRRDVIVKGLNDIPGISCVVPDGAFYAFPDVRGCLKNGLKTSGDFAQALLEKEHVVVTDGAGFGTEGFVRMSYATSMEQIQEGVRRIKKFVTTD